MLDTLLEQQYLYTAKPKIKEKKEKKIKEERTTTLQVHLNHYICRDTFLDPGPRYDWIQAQ